MTRESNLLPLVGTALSSGISDVLWLTQNYYVIMSVH